jgi:TolB-like protein/tRNA A-37 threonylcarbamoyl transferase component Bud32
MNFLDQLQATLGSAYSVERELGGGGMSRVFLAEETALGRKVVIKTLNPDLGAGLSAERFAREVRLAASLQHPNIVPVLATGIAAGTPYYTMPYVKGESLRTLVGGSGPLPHRKAISVLRDVARALEFAHAEGVIHRDIKPDNVLIAGHAALVSDFGIAKAISVARTSAPPEGLADPGTGLTIAGVSVGTPAYMAPEQVAADVVDSRSDIYAWGVVAYEVLSGAHPFAGRATAQQMMAAHLSQAPPRLADRAPGISVALSDLVMRCLEKNPEKRPGSATELLETLDSTDSSDTQRTPTILRRRRAVIPAVIGIIAVAAVVYVVAAKMRGAGTSTARRSIAVLPFAFDPGDSTDAYFGAGIADELMSALGKVPGLRVASRTSAFAVGGQRDLDVREIGRRLGVATVVEGTVRRAGDRLRVTAQLTNASDGLTLWSDTYERESKDVFAVQDDITRSIVDALRLELASDGGTGRAAPKGPGTSDPEAYDLYLRGLYLLERRGAGVERSADYFSQAIAKDSMFARAYAALADALEFFPYFAGTPPARIERRATAAARRALAIDAGLAEPRVALAMAHMHAFRWKEAETEFRRAIAADSTSSSAHTQFGRYLIGMGRIPEALEEFRRARALDPLAGTASVWLSHAHSLMGHHDSAWAESKRARELDPSLATAQTILAIDRLAVGRADQARQIAGVGLPRIPFNGMTAYVFQLSGDTGRAGEIRRVLDHVPDTTWQVHTARVYGYMATSDTSKALTEMEAAFSAREILPTWSSFPERMYDPVRRSARFAAVVRDYGLDVQLMTSPRGGRPAP